MNNHHHPGPVRACRACRACSAGGDDNGNETLANQRASPWTTELCRPRPGEGDTGHLPDPLDSLAHKHGRLPLSARINRITWAWFPVSMSTGAMASLLSQQPWTFRGLTALGTAVFLLDAALFALLTALVALRFARRPRALAASLHHPSEAFFFGAFWVSLALVLQGVQAYGVPALRRRGHDAAWLAAALRVLFWAYVACAMLVAVVQYHAILYKERLRVRDEAVPAWVLPAYPFLLSGPLAAAVAETQPAGRAALQIIIGGLAGQGLGWLLSLLVYSVFLTRLMAGSLPRPDARPGLYVSVGPAGYTCAGLLALGRQARAHVPPGYLAGVELPVGELWYAMSVPAALFLWLFAVWFSALTTLNVLRGARRMRFSLQWWAFVFPNAGLVLATIQVGNALESTGIKAVGAALTVVLVPLWFLCAVLHIRDLWKHELLAPGKDGGVNEVNGEHSAEQEKTRNKTEQV